MNSSENRKSLLLLLTSVVVLFLGLCVSLAHSYSEKKSPPLFFSQPADTGTWIPRSLQPVPNPAPKAPKQIARIRPYHVAVAPNGGKAYVTLSGKEISPGSEVLVIDVKKRAELRRIPVGSQPYGIMLHPSGRWVVVANRFSNFLSVIDVNRDKVISQIPVPFYCEDMVFSPDGKWVYVSNFWKNQVLVIDLDIEDDRLTGRMLKIGFDRDAFFGTYKIRKEAWNVCEVCGWRQMAEIPCQRCGKKRMKQKTFETRFQERIGVVTALRGRCGSADCHLYGRGGFYAGPDKEKLLQSVLAHLFPGDPKASPLLRVVVSSRNGGWADGVDGRHHAGGIVFEDPEKDPDYRRLSEWIASGVEGPGISVGNKPRDLLVSRDGKTLYVANTGSLDISVIDLEHLRESRRIFTRSPVNDMVEVEDFLVLATLGVGSGHPKSRNPDRESPDRNHPGTEFTLFRDPKTGRPLPLEKQKALGPYDDIDGTLQEKFRDITNDIVLLHPSVNNAASYRATEKFTRYTSDSFEVLPGDKKGDVPPELLKVVGSFPEQMVKKGNRLYIAMSGTFQIQEWEVDLDADPARRLIPGRVFETGYKPTGIDFAGDTLITVNQLGDSITFIDLKDGRRQDLVLNREAPPFPANDFERGEFFVQTSVFSVDQDQSCVHCHYRDTSDGKRWSVSQVMGQSRSGEERTGGSREVPDIRALVHNVPFFVEGTLSMDEPLTMMMEHNPLVDFQGVTPAGNFSKIFVNSEEEGRYAKSADTLVVATGNKWNEGKVRIADLIKRREIHFKRIAREYLGMEYTFREFQKFIGVYQGGEPRLLPNPVDPEGPMVRYGRKLFESPEVGCSGCHPAPAFTDKVNVYNQNKAFPPLVTPAPRDNAHTLISADRMDYLNGFIRPWDREDKGRFEEQEGFFVAPSLRGIWARPPKFLHHGHGVHLREVIATPGHPALRRFPFERNDAHREERWEKGLNERHGVPDTHGVTSHLSVWDMECLVKFVLSIE